MGFWQVFNSLEAYTGGPLRSDLVVDTNIYNCALSPPDMADDRLPLQPPRRFDAQPHLRL